MRAENKSWRSKSGSSVNAVVAEQVLGIDPAGPLTGAFHVGPPGRLRGRAAPGAGIEIFPPSGRLGEAALRLVVHAPSARGLAVAVGFAEGIGLSARHEPVLGVGGAPEPV